MIAFLDPKFPWYVARAAVDDDAPERLFGAPCKRDAR